MTNKKYEEDALTMALIDKIKNESYGYKCERDQLKAQIHDLKLFKENFNKEIDKIQDKYTKAKERSRLLEKGIVKLEAEKRDIETKYLNTYSDFMKRHDSLNKEYDNMKRGYFEMNKELIDLRVQNEEYKSSLEEYKVNTKELKDKYNKLEKLKSNRELYKSE
jgi:chromosome segregation ATPase